MEIIFNHENRFSKIEELNSIIPFTDDRFKDKLTTIILSAIKLSSNATDTHVSILDKQTIDIVSKSKLYRSELDLIKTILLNGKTKYTKLILRDLYHSERTKKIKLVARNSKKVNDISIHVLELIKQLWQLNANFNITENKHYQELIISVPIEKDKSKFSNVKKNNGFEYFILESPKYSKNTIKPAILLNHEDYPIFGDDFSSLDYNTINNIVTEFGSILEGKKEESKIFGNMIYSIEIKKNISKIFCYNLYLGKEKTTDIQAMFEKFRRSLELFNKL